MPSKVAVEKKLIQAIIDKGSLKQEVYNQTLECFNSFKSSGKKLIRENKKKVLKARYPLPFDFSERGKFEFQLQFGSDILIFFMHSNVFEIPRDHAVMKTGYIREDKSRSYCGIIHIFNFLADSFKYNRTNDVGYCIGRIFINRENHYFIEGKREVGLLYNDFPTSTLDVKSVQQIIQSAIQYTINFDLLTPPFDNIKEVSVVDMQTTLDAFAFSTGKRIGYRFQADGL